MGFIFKTDQPQTETPSVTTTKLSVVEENEEQDLVQRIFTPEEEAKLMIDFIEDNGLYPKFLLYCGLQEQLKSLKGSLETQVPDCTL
jgi:hypothetical protein